MQLPDQAQPMSRKMNRDGEFAYGAGQVNPTRAVNPGLIYDSDYLSYLQLLCQQGYNGSSLTVLVGESVNCSSLLPGLGYDALNYPTMQLDAQSDGQEPIVDVFRRTVTNVGCPNSVYNVTIKAAMGVQIVVKPTSLSFSRVLQKRSFKVVVKSNQMSASKMVAGSIAWKSSTHVVRSPIVVYSYGDS